MKGRGVIALIRKHVLTAIGYMIPLAVAAGLCIALGQFMNGDVGSSVSGIGCYFYKAGGFEVSAVVPVITAGVAYSITDRPRIAPGLILGFICTEIKADFIGGTVAGLLVGYLVLTVKKYIKPPKAMQELIPVMVIPVLVTAAASVLMFTVMGRPFTQFQVTLTEAISSLQSRSKFMFGAVLGGMVCFNFGGPVSKTISTFTNGLTINGVIGPETVKFVGSMVPPFDIAISCLLTRNEYARAEKEALKTAIPMRFCMITEDMIPITARDLIRVIFSCVYGSTMAGGLFMVWGCGSPIPHGDILSVPLFTNPVKFCLALAIGSVITGAILSLIKKPMTEDDESFEDLGDVMDTAGNGDGGDTKIETL